MIRGFPTFGENARKGEAGVNHVCQIVSDEFQWIFKRNHQEHDFGIDGLIEVVSSNGAVTGKIIAAQIKFGKSFFNEEGPLGYIYRGEF